MILGIVGNGADKFTPAGEASAKKYIQALLIDKRIESNLLGQPLVVRSGHSIMKGIDIWTEEIARSMGITLDIRAPLVERWEPGYGYKARNMDIAESDEVEVIVADTYPPNFPESEKRDWCKIHKVHHCYHCHTPDHVKSGACWTGKQAQKIGKKVAWILVHNDGGANRIR